MRTSAFIFGFLSLACLVIAQEPAVALPDAAPPAATPEESTEAAPPPAATSTPENPVVEGLGQAIPQAYTADRYSAVWGRNPFMTKVTTPQGPTVNPFEDWVLSGLTVRASGETSCFVRNKQTQESQKVTAKPNPKAPDGFILVQANPNKDRKLASVEVSKNGQTGTLKFEDVAAGGPPAGTPGIAAPGMQRVPMPGQPGQVNPGAPGVPNGGQVQPGRRIVTPNQTGQVPGAPNQPGNNPGNIPQAPGMQRPQGMAGTVVGGAPTNIPRSPSNRRRILIPPPVASPDQQNVPPP